MKKRLLMIGLCLVMSVPAVLAEVIEPEHVIITKDCPIILLEKIKLQRNTMYNALNLTQCQIQKKNEIDKKRYDELEAPLQRMCIARKKFDEMAKSENCSTPAVKAVKKDFDTAKNDISSITKKYDKEFTKILTSEQKSKYSMIRKLKKEGMKKLHKIQENGRKQGDLRPFGKPVSQADYSQKMKQQNSIWSKLKKCKNKEVK